MILGPVQKIGKILHISNLAKDIIIVKLEESVRLGSIIYDSGMREVGHVIEIFGPVKAPYARVKVRQGMDVRRLIGSEVYIILGDETRVKWRKMPRPKKGKIA